MHEDPQRECMVEEEIPGKHRQISFLMSDHYDIKNKNPEVLVLTALSRFLGKDVYLLFLLLTLVFST